MIYRQMKRPSVPVAWTMSRGYLTEAQRPQLKSQEQPQDIQDNSKRLMEQFA